MAAESSSSLTDDLRSGLAQVLEAVAERLRGQKALEGESETELERTVEELRKRVETLEAGQSGVEPKTVSGDAEQVE